MSSQPELTVAELRRIHNFGSAFNVLLYTVSSQRDRGTVAVDHAQEAADAATRTLGTTLASHPEVLDGWNDQATTPVEVVALIRLLIEKLSPEQTEVRASLTIFAKEIEQWLVRGGASQ